MWWVVHIYGFYWLIINMICVIIFFAYLRSFFYSFLLKSVLSGFFCSFVI